MTIIKDAKEELDEVIGSDPNLSLTDEAISDVSDIIREDSRANLVFSSTVGCKNQNMKVGAVVGVIGIAIGVLLGMTFFGRSQ